MGTVKNTSSVQLGPAHPRSPLPSAQSHAPKSPVIPSNAKNDLCTPSYHDKILGRAQENCQSDSRNLKNSCLLDPPCSNHEKGSPLFRVLCEAEPPHQSANHGK